MAKHSKTHDDTSPGRTSAAGRKGQQKSQVVVGITPKQPALPAAANLIQDIKISDDEQGIIIEYEQNVQTEKLTELLLLGFGKVGITVTAKTLPDPKPHIVLILEGVHFEGKRFKDIHLNEMDPYEAYRLILHQLDRSSISSLINKLIMKGREEKSAKFTYKDVSKIPPGVDPLQLDFLREAATVGAFEWVKSYTEKMIEEYFTTEATYADLAKKYGITKQAVSNRITRGMGKIQRVLYRNKPELAQEDKYPLEQIKRGKNEVEIFKTERSKTRRGQASGSSIKRPGADILISKTEPPEPK